MPGDFAPSRFIGTGMRIQRPDCCKPNDPGRANPGFHSLSHRGWRSPRSGMKTKSHTRESHTRNTHTRESRTRVIWDFKLWFGGRIRASRTRDTHTRNSRTRESRTRVIRDSELWFGGSDPGFRTLVRGVGSRDSKLWFGGSDPGFRTLVRGVGSGISNFGSVGRIRDCGGRILRRQSRSNRKIGGNPPFLSHAYGAWQGCIWVG